MLKPEPTLGDQDRLSNSKTTDAHTHVDPYHSARANRHVLHDRRTLLLRRLAAGTQCWEQNQNVQTTVIPKL